MTPSPSYRAQPQQRQQQMQQPRQPQQRQYYGAPQQQGAPASNVATQAPAQSSPAPQQPPAQPVNAWGAANDAWRAQQNGGGAPAQPTQPPAPIAAPVQTQPQAQPSYLDVPASAPTSELGGLAGMASPHSMKLDASGGDAPPREASDVWGGGGDAMREAPLDAPDSVESGGMGGPQRRHGMGGLGRRSFYGE